MLRRFLPLAALVALVLLAFAAPSQAANRTVFAGYGGGPGVFKQLDTNSFFRSHVTIHQGDSVTWVFRGFHDVAFLGGGARPSLVVPNLAIPVSGATDAAGAPYWFNGQPNLDINPMVAFPTGRKTFKTRTFIGSGLPLSDKPHPFRLRFNTRGTFTYYCLVHRGMSGRVTVISRHHHIPSARANAHAARVQLARLVSAAKHRDALPAPGGATVQAGRSTSEYSIEKFFPASLTVKVGQLVTFTMAQDTAAEPHTVTFGPDAVTKPVADSFVTPVSGTDPAAPPEIRFDPRAAYPSSPPGPTPVAYDLTNHGNGLENLALLDNDPTTPTVGNQVQVSFKTPGTYHYICAVHDGMAGDVVVTP